MTAELSLPECTVLAALAQQPAHGFAVAQLTARGGQLGRVWQIPRPVIYRAIGRLLDAGLIVAVGVEPGRGPQRTIYAVNDEGRQAAERWLATPVAHVRDVRSVFLLKLALLDRAGTDPHDLIRRQREVLEQAPSRRWNFSMRLVVLRLVLMSHCDYWAGPMTCPAGEGDENP